MTEPERDTWQPLGSVLASLAARLRAGAAAEGRGEAVANNAGCPDCDGVGYYKLAVPLGHPDFGVLFPCVCRQAERTQRQRDELMRLGNLAAVRGMTFATFDQEVSGMQDAYDAAWHYAQTLSGWLLLLGSYGVGKTHLAAAVAWNALEQQRAVLFVVVPDLLDHLRATFGPSSETTYDERFEQVRTAPLLILDDLGTEAATPWAKEKLFQLLNHRYQERLPTVITSNHSLNELEPQLASRLADRRLCQVLQIEAEDYRRFGGAVRLELTGGSQAHRKGPDDD